MLSKKGEGFRVRLYVSIYNCFYQRRKSCFLLKYHRLLVHLCTELNVCRAKYGKALLLSDIITRTVLLFTWVKACVKASEIATSSNVTCSVRNILIYLWTIPKILFRIIKYSSRKIIIIPRTILCNLDILFLYLE